MVARLSAVSKPLLGFNCDGNYCGTAFNRRVCSATVVQTDHIYCYIFTINIGSRMYITAYSNKIRIHISGYRRILYTRLHRLLAMPGMSWYNDIYNIEQVLILKLAPYT